MKSDEFSATTEIPTTPPQPDTMPKEPMPAEYRAWLYGSLVGLAMFFGAVVGVSALITSSDKTAARAKADQVESCSNITEPNAAFLCVEQVED